MIPIPLKFAAYKSYIIKLEGGVNENVSSLELTPGELIDCKNYMIAEGGLGGYISIKGFERFDGKVTPSLYESFVLNIESSSREIVAGQTVTGGTSGATGVALESSQLVSGTYAGGNAKVTVQIRIVTSQFSTGESLSTVSGAVGTLTLAESIVGGTPKYNLGIIYARTQVTAVPGEGKILGLHVFEGKVYAFRKKVGANTVGMYTTSATTGWTEVNTSANPLSYSAGNHDFHFSNYNFLSGSDSFSMYWCDSVNKARAFDGTIVTVIDNTGMGANDKPINILAYNNHLWLAYLGGSLQQSKIGTPNNWVGADGAAEYGMGSEITNLETNAKSALIVILANGIKIISGTSIANFVVETYSTETGGFKRSAKSLLGTTFFVGNRGLTTLEAVQEFGNFGANSISQRFKKSLFRNNHTINSTITSRELNQYRIFFNDRTALYVSFEGKDFKGATTIEYNKVLMNSSGGDSESGRELLVFSADETDGMVYLMDSGTSFDGTSITTRMSSPYFHYGSPRLLKAFKKTTIEVNGADGQFFNIKVDFDYNEIDNPKTIWYSSTIYSTEGAAIYGESKWGLMKYGLSSSVTNRVPVYLQGIGTNMSYKIISNETYREQHTVQNIITDYELIGRRV